MRAFDMRRIGSPACSFESWGIKESIVYGDETLSYAIFDCIQIIRTKLIGDKAVNGKSALPT